MIRVRTGSQDATNRVREITGLKGKSGVPSEPKHLGFYADMPEFVQPKSAPHCLFEFETDLPSAELSELFEQKITDKTKSIWYPKLDRSLGDWGWVDDSGLKPRCPIYVISKGRPACITARALSRMGADFKIVIEQEDAESYKAWGDRLHVGSFVNDSRSSIPVRNYVDDICESDRYWLIDDNIEDFNILNRNQKYVCRTPVIFRAAEDFFARFSNIGMAGLNYYSFAKKTEAVPPYYLNTRIYSCTLMHKNVDGVRVDGKLWRGRHNEDTDLSLRVLKAGYGTMLLNTFLAGKMTTQRARGGNTDSVYASGDNRREFAESLVRQHQDVARVVKRFGRWHHHVDYSPFAKNDLGAVDSYEVFDYKLRLDPVGRTFGKTIGATNGT